MRVMKVLPVFLAVAFFSAPTVADEKAALEEINATVHGVTKTEVKSGRLDIEVINVGADYNFMSQVSCRLLAKHKISDVSEVIIRDSSASGPEKKVLGKFRCNEAAK